MNIATIQKRKFLNNIYKILYSSGKKPTDYQVRRAFNQYFRANKLGQPLDIDLAPINSLNVIDPNVLNELMINSMLNLETLYDCVMENNQEVFSIITALNSKLENLRIKRKILEGKIDQLIFSNANSDGFFYSYLENFSSTANIDLSMTSAFIDTINNNVSIPKIVSEYSSQVTSQNVNASGVKYSTTFNSRSVASDITATNFDLALDGLNDTYWDYGYEADSPGIFSIAIDIPVTSALRVSKVQGSIISETPCSIYLSARSASTNGQEVLRIKDSKSDFTRFSFMIPADAYSNIRLTIFKSEPDKLIQNNTNPYLYQIGIRELVIGADFYDTSAQLVSKAISLPSSDNELLSISAVSIDAEQQTTSGTEVDYYIASDVENATSIADFNWIPIEPTNFKANVEPNLVNLIGSIFSTKYIDNSELVNYDYTLIPKNSNSLNINELNPTVLPFSEKEVYRVASVPNEEKFLQPYMLTGLGSYRHYNVLKDNSKLQTQDYRSLESWADIISNNTNFPYTLNYINSFNSTLNLEISSNSSGLIETKILCPEPKKVSYQLIKSDIRLNVSIFMNGGLIADIPAGTKDANVEWNFTKGINNITIGYDKPFLGTPSIKIMNNGNLDNFGTVFLDYFSYLDPLEFRRRTDPSLSYFTIDNLYGSKEIIASKEISNRTILKYYSDRSNQVTAIRYRLDLNRYTNPLQSPVVDAIRVKFKHSDI